MLGRRLSPQTGEDLGVSHIIGLELVAEVQAA
jgi:hypothetical protein